MLLLLLLLMEESEDQMIVEAIGSEIQTRRLAP